MDKKQLRKEAIHRQKSLPKEKKKQIELVLTSNLLTSNLWKESHTIGVTVSMSFEWDTLRIMKSAWKNNKTICVPQAIKEGNKLLFYRLDRLNELERSGYGILEPTENFTKIEKNDIDLLIVPGLLFDRNGYRIGFGGGYYDRFLVGFQNKTVSLLSEEQLIDQVPKTAHDIPVQYLVTEKGLLKT